MTLPLLNALSDQNVAVILCGENRLPNAMLLNQDSNKTQGESYRAQIEASEPLKKKAVTADRRGEDIFGLCTSLCFQREHASTYQPGAQVDAALRITSILSVTDKQYGETLNYWGKLNAPDPKRLTNWNFFDTFVRLSLKKNYIQATSSTRWERFFKRNSDINNWNSIFY